MKKGKQTALIIVEAGILLLAAGGFFMIQQKQIQPTTVYQYSRDLHETSIVSASDITAVTVPKDGITPTMVQNPDDIIGKAVDSDVYAGDYVTAPVLIEPEDIDKFATMDLSNYRQIAIEVSRQDCVGGNLSSGDTVDLTFISNGTSKEAMDEQPVEFTYATTFMEDVLVYKVLTPNGDEYINQTDGTVYDADGNKVVTTPGIVILAVTADQAEEIYARQSKGTIKLVGRFEASENSETSGYIIGDYGKVYTYYANPED